MLSDAIARAVCAVARRGSKWFWSLGSILVFPGLLLCSGCAVHYYDRKTATEHIWGFGHMKMRTGEANEGLNAVVHATEVLGLSTGKADRQIYTTLGWHRVESIDIRRDDIQIRLERPKGTFWNVRVGSSFPTNSSPNTTVDRRAK